MKTKRLSLFHKDDVVSFLKKNPIHVVDAGARGGLSVPWLYFKKGTIFTYGFEPDRDEYLCLAAQNDSNGTYYHTALWNKEENIDLFLSIGASTSSVFEHNIELLQRNFPPKNWEKRRLSKIIPLKANTLDNVLQTKTKLVDFLKIDVHGAEFEILEGAKSCLDSVSGVFVEAWTVEVHKKQKLFSSVFDLLYSKGFELYHINPDYMSWEHKNNALYNVDGRKRPIGVNMFFLKRTDKLVNWSEEKIIKAIIIAEVHGFSGYALELSTLLKNRSWADFFVSFIRNKYARNNSKKSLKARILRKLEYLMRKYDNAEDIYQVDFK